MEQLRIVFMGTPEFAVPCLETLLAAHHEVVAVVTQPDRPKGRGQKLAYSAVKEAALAHNLPILQPQKIKEPEFLAEMERLQPDMIVVVAFGQFLPKVLLDLPRLGCINVHASLLPAYRGAAPIHWAVMDGCAVSGVTTMYMDIGMDTGDMILKEEYTIIPDMTTGELHDALKIVGARVLRQTVQQLANGSAVRVPQEEAAATYASLLTRDIERIDWKRSAQDLHNQIRGLNPWPGAYCQYQDKVMKLWQSRLYDAAAVTQQPGRIAAITAQGIVVETGAGLLEITEMQPQSKRRMAARDCASGYALTIGTILE